VSPGDTVEASLKSFINAADSIAGTGNQMIMKFDYFSDFGGVFGTADYISSTEIVIANGSTPNNQWFDHVLSDTAPAGAVEARLALVFAQTGFDGGAVHLDAVTFVNQDIEFDADADADGDTDLSDLLQWQRGFGEESGTSVAGGDFDYNGVVDGGDLAAWEGLAATVVSAAVPVPEPGFTFFLAWSVGLAAYRHAGPFLPERAVSGRSF